MSFVAEFEFDHPNVILGDTIDHCDEACIRVAYSTPVEHSSEERAFAVITHSGDWDEIDAALDADGTVHSVTRLFRLQNHTVYRFNWHGRGLNFWRETARMGVFVERVWAKGGRWHARLHLPTRRLVGQIREILEDSGFNVSLSLLCAFEPFSTQNGATESQLDLLQDAHERGYFRVPRTVTQKELADKYDITESAVSQQIRRGLNNVLTEFFKYGPSSTEPLEAEYFGESEHDS